MTTKETKTQMQTRNEAGLCSHCDNVIFVKRDGFDDDWQVLKTKIGISQVSVMFAFETDGQAWEAAKKIAKAIGGEFYGKTDPRKI